MAAGARALGATIVRRNRVTGVTRLPSGEFRVKTEQGNVTCEHLVNAAGCYAREVGKWLGVDTPITNMEHQYLVTEPLAEFKDSPVELPVMRDPGSSASLTAPSPIRRMATPSSGRCRVCRMLGNAAARPSGSRRGRAAASSSPNG
jgi:glycine/D-amino acid oxidase-like deaminating enzyme